MSNTNFNFSGDVTTNSKTKTFQIYDQSFLEMINHDGDATGKWYASVNDDIINPVTPDYFEENILHWYSDDGITPEAYHLAIHVNILTGEATLTLNPTSAFSFNNGTKLKLLYWEKSGNRIYF